MQKTGFLTTWQARIYLTAVAILSIITLIGCSSSDDVVTVNGPVPNPYLSSSIYSITHFDSSQSDSTPYGTPTGEFAIDPAKQPIVYGGLVNIITLASTDKDYMWQVGTDRVSYVNKASGQWTRVAKFEAFADATGNTFQPILDLNFKTFGESSPIGMSVSSMDAYLTSLFGANYSTRFGNGTYVVVDKDNVLYANYGDTLYGFALVDPKIPSAGITARYKLNNMIATFQGSNPPPPPGTRLTGISMTYDGYLVVIFSNGIAVINRTLNPAYKVFYRFADTEFVSNSIAIDEKNGIYVASGSTNSNPGIMRKLVWTGSTISDKESDGAWSSPYDSSGLELPPIIKFGNGTGSTPTLMGFGSDPDKLVVITDGAKRMKLVAFWRNAIPDGFVQKPGTASRRIAGQIQVTCGFTKAPDWIQSEQSVVVNGYGAFVVNNIPETINSEIIDKNKILQVAMMGPVYTTSYGIQRFQWNTSTKDWNSVWERSDLSSTSMVPIYSKSSNMALINGYRPSIGWEVVGVDWNSGKIVHQTRFGNKNYGNGAYAILQYLEGSDLLFNSIVGPMRITYSK